MSDKASAAEPAKTSSGPVDVSNDYSKWDKWAVGMDSSDEEQQEKEEKKAKPPKKKKYDGPKYTPAKILPPTTNPTSPHFFHGIEGRQEHSPVDVCGDGSVIKVITRDGNGPADWIPIKGDKCDVHYIGILENGTKFDSR